MLAAESPDHGGECPRIFRSVRGNPMAKAALENAIWDLEAQREGILARTTCSVAFAKPFPAAFRSAFNRPFPSCSRSSSVNLPPVISASSSSASRDGTLRFSSAVRNRWPGIMLSCDANSAYRLRDEDHLVSFDAFDLLMIEQPLWHDDFYFHSVLQKRLDTPICLDESIRNRRDALAAIEMESCKIINIKLGRVGGFSEAIAVHNAALERGIPVWCGGMLESGVGRAHNIALSSLEGLHAARAMSLPRRATGPTTSSSRKLQFPRRARLRFPILRAAATKSART